MADDERSRGRAHWPVRAFRVGEQPSEDLSLSTTPEERLAMMWPLALDAWALTGQALPDYSRRETPVRAARRPADKRTAPK